eukprot:gene12497-8932_t
MLPSSPASSSSEAADSSSKSSGSMMNFASARARATRTHFQDCATPNGRSGPASGSASCAAPSQRPPPTAISAASLPAN